MNRKIPLYTLYGQHTHLPGGQLARVRFASIVDALLRSSEATLSANILDSAS